MVARLASGTWDGDRDNLATAPEGELWQPIAAEAASCTGKHCPLFSRCTYFERRKELVGAQIIVANHDLLLSSLGSRVLPELERSAFRERFEAKGRFRDYLRAMPIWVIQAEVSPALAGVARALDPP